MDQEIKSYYPNQKAKIGLFKTLFIFIRDSYQSRELIYQLFKRDFLMMYKKSFFGFGWHLFAPILGIVSWLFMNSAGVLNPGDIGGVPYPAYVLLGTSFWGLFMSFYSGASTTLSSGKGFIEQVNYPHYVLLTKNTLQQLVNFSLSFTAAIVLIIIIGVIPSWKIIFFPLMLLPLFFLSSAIGLIVSLTHSWGQDINKIMGSFLGILMFFTPVIYSPKNKEGWIQDIIQYNPLTYLVGEIRNLILMGEIVEPLYYLYFSLASLILFTISFRLFFITEDKLIEKLI